jgi:hypothetical protein
MTQERPKVALIDADFFVYRIGFASEGEDEKYAKARVTEWLTDMVYMDLKCEDYKMYITGKTNFRDSIAVTQPYKGNRVGMKKPQHYECLREHLQRLGAVVTEGQEADDAVGIENTRGSYIMVHVDKDLDQLPGTHYNPVKCLEYTIGHFEGLKKFYTQVLTGDPTDFIPGLFRVGPKKAAKVLEGKTTEEELYDAVFKMYQDKGHTKEYLVEQARLLWLRREEGQLWEPPC